MKLQAAAPTTSALVSRALLGAQPQSIGPLATRRLYATQNGANTTGSGSTSTRRRAVTPFNDDGHVPWTELSAGEKGARAVQQSFNFGMVIVGLALTGTIGYFLWSDVFSPDSKVTQYNRAVDRIKKDPRCLELLGDSKRITAYGEETSNKWRRARPIASTARKDAQGGDHLIMHFNVEGPRGNGVANLHLVKRPGQDDFEYKYFFVDIQGHQRIYLEKPDSLAPGGGGKKSSRLFGINWGS